MARFLTGTCAVVSSILAKSFIVITPYSLLTCVAVEEFHGVLTASVAMKNPPCLAAWRTFEPGCSKGIDDARARHAFPQRPAHNLAAEKIDNSVREIDEEPLENMALARKVQNRSAFRPQMQIYFPKSGPRAVQFAGKTP
jgi:hypothetical protein